MPSWKSIYSSVFIIRMITATVFATLVGSATLWFVGDRLLTHSLEGDRRRVDDIVKRLNELDGKIQNQEDIFKEVSGALKALQLKNDEDIRELIIKILGKEANNLGNVETIIETIRSLESNSYLLSLIGPHKSKPESVPEEPIKVGFVYVGPISDYGWSYRHDLGRKAIETRFGTKVQTSILENVPEGTDAVRAITELAESGLDIIFTTSFGFMDPTNEVAKNYPNVKFENATGFKRESENVSTFSARHYEGKMIQGQIAAKKTKTNKIGYIASFPIPEVVRGINAFYLEMRKHNTDTVLEVKWLFTWFDPEKEAQAARELIENGVDIIAQHTESTAPIAVAEMYDDVFVLGHISNMDRFGGKSHLVSSIDSWDSYYIERVSAVLDGSWDQANTWWGLSNGVVNGGIGMVKMDGYSNMTKEIKTEAIKLENALKSGERHPFECPIYKQSGELAEDCAKGYKHLQDEPTLSSMDWYVKGIGNITPP